MNPRKWLTGPTIGQASSIALLATPNSLPATQGQRWANRWTCERLVSTQTAEPGRLVCSG